MTLTARLVDPRDITTEESDPTYRVYFWTKDGSRCREYDVDGVDVVEEVIAWAEAEAQSFETYILGVRWTSAAAWPDGTHDVVFVRLKGDPPPGQSVGRRRGDDPR